MISVPTLSGPALAGLPADSRGFIPVDAHGRVAGTPGVYAAGDATTFPVKQGGLATQQADAVAEAVAADLGLRRRPDALPARPARPAPHRRRAALPPRRARPATASRRRDGCAARSRAERCGGRRARSPAATWLPISARPAPRASAPSRCATGPSAAGASPAADRDEAYELALLLAEQDAALGDYRSALHALDAAAALAGGVLPEEWVASRERWQRELAVNT